ncbi:YidH family protein [Chlorogloeopsis sp. ULAP02]|uniref:YidH family protein n=1 Tax=Chlorogloeopsis sp. ULAP02 TaxID=3107926 RepID=UPI003135FDFE
MNDPIPPLKPPNIQVELAKERNRAAAERTLMAWIRTNLSLIGFGFGIDRVVAAIENFKAVQDLNPVRFSRILGLAFIALGTYAMVFAAIEHHQELHRIQRQEEYFYIPRRSLGLTVAIALVCIGVFAFVGILVKAIF